MHDGLIRAPYSFLVTHDLMVYLWVFRLDSTFPSPVQNSPAVSGGVRAIFLAPNRSIPSAWWSLLINHITMFHNLGITASMSLITICALHKPKGSVLDRGWNIRLNCTSESSRHFKSGNTASASVCWPAPKAMFNSSWMIRSPPAEAVEVRFRF